MQEDDGDDERDDTPLAGNAVPVAFSAQEHAPPEDDSAALTARRPQPQPSLAQPAEHPAPTSSPDAAAAPGTRSTLRSLESAAATALSGFASAADSPLMDSPSAAAAVHRGSTRPPTSLPRFESQPLRQDSQPPQPEPEPLDASQDQTEGNQGRGAPGGEKRLSRFAIEAGTANVVDSAAEFKQWPLTDAPASVPEGETGMHIVAREPSAAPWQPGTVVDAASAQCCTASRAARLCITLGVGHHSWSSSCPASA